MNVRRCLKIILAKKKRENERESAPQVHFGQEKRENEREKVPQDDFDQEKKLNFIYLITTKSDVVE